ncbi:unnamed protein product [Pseudo-nitzschia multistriata]|uniref:Uncharacterized protein n=1 Tax=Pseudo-nitzschia multistriata TaxID=183589 RepID=A0A448YYY2_9STRA|nr:unnamed protein product [Pseudo-nitzschia multistriata]
MTATVSIKTLGLSTFLLGCALVAASLVVPLVQPFAVPKPSFHIKQRIPTELFSTSASAAYLESISYRSPTVEDGLLGATSKYLDALSSVSAQLNNNYGNNNYDDNYSAYAATEAASKPSVSAASTPFSDDMLVNEVVQRVTQEFSSALNAFGGETYDSVLDGLSSTLVSQSVPQYLWDMDDFDLGDAEPKPAAKVARAAARKASQQEPQNSVNPEETMRELSNKLEGSFRSFKESLSSSTHSVTSSFRRETAQPNAAVTTAKQQENILQIQQKLDDGQLSPEALSQSAMEVANKASTMAEAANKAVVESIPSDAETVVNSLGETLSGTASGAAHSLSETASSANSAISETQRGLQNSIGSLVTNANQGIGKALSTLAESTSAAKSSIAESAGAASSAVTSAFGEGASSIAESTNAASSAVSSAIGGGASSIAETASVASSAAASAIGGATSGTAKALAATAVTARESVGATGAAVKAAVVTAKPGMAATSGKVSAVTLSANQGFGLPGNAYSGGGDVAGLVEMVVATVASIPRSILDATMMETNHPGAMDDLMEGISTGLYRDILVPLSEPLSGAAASTSTTPMEQAQAVLETSQMVMAMVVSIPRAVVEGVTGQPISEVQARVAQADLDVLAAQLSGFAATVSKLLVSFLKVVAQAISYLVSQGGGGAAIGTEQTEAIAKLVTVLLEDILPAIIDGLAMVLQQFVLLLLDGGAAIVLGM